MPVAQEACAANSRQRDVVTTMKDSLRDLSGELSQFAEDRDWKQFHSPKNPAWALAVEAGKPSEHFQRLTAPA